MTPSVSCLAQQWPVSTSVLPALPRVPLSPGASQLTQPARLNPCSTISSELEPSPALPNAVLKPSLSTITISALNDGALQSSTHQSPVCAVFCALDTNQACFAPVRCSSPIFRLATGNACLLGPHPHTLTLPCASLKTARPVSAPAGPPSFAITSVVLSINSNPSPFSSWSFLAACRPDALPPPRFPLKSKATERHA